MRKSFLIIFLALFCLGMAHRPSEAYTIRGKVTDSGANQPLVTSQIKLTSLLGQPKASGLIDTNGNYELRNLSFPRYGSFYILTASKDGYASKAITCFLKNGKTYIFDFKLKSLNKNNPPKIISLTPKDRSTFVTGDTINISITATDSNKDPLQYRYLMDDKIIKDWTTSSNFTLKTSIQNIGRHRIKIEVKDNKGGFDSKTVDIYIFIAFPKPG